ncbi:MAG: hypothetical protein ACFB0E_17430 [Leptolyngbyaceae cyanobacterium]
MFRKSRSPVAAVENGHLIPGDAPLLELLGAIADADNLLPMGGVIHPPPLRMVKADI